MTPAELSLVVPGCEVWDIRGDEAPEVTDAAEGGVVWAVDRLADPETGEVEDFYRWARPWRKEVRSGLMPASAVRQWSPPNDAHLRRLVRHACAVVSLSRGALDGRDLEAVELAYALTHITRRPA